MTQHDEKPPATFYYDILNYVSEQLGPDYPESVLTCVIRYHVNGCFAVIADWITTDLERPQEYIVKTLSELDKSIYAYLRSQQT